MARYILGTRVYTSDDINIGLIDRLIVGPRTRRLEGFVVRKGLMLERDVVIPAGDVAPAVLDDMGGILRLTISAEETDRMLAYQEQSPVNASVVPGAGPRREEMHTARTRIAEAHPTSAILHTGTKVIGQHGMKIGAMKEIMADEHTGAITEVIAKRGPLDGSEARIPIGLVEYVADDAVYVAVEKDCLRHFIYP
jgi:sporulation protein YlmC with PRC-barrel domain